MTFFFIFESIKINNMDLELILELNGTLEVIMFFVLLAALFGWSMYDFANHAKSS